MPLPPLTAFSGERLQETISKPGWFRFCVIRHPYNRFFSVWRDKIFLIEPGFEAYAPPGDEKIVEFEHFLAQVISRDDPCRCDPHWQAQVSLLLPDDIAYTRIYDISDISNLPGDLKTHLVAIGINEDVPRLPKINRSWSIPAEGFFTVDVMAALHQFYHADFARFNFPNVDKHGSSTTKAADWVNEFSNGVFERNQMIIRTHPTRSDRRKKRSGAVTVVPAPLQAQGGAGPLPICWRAHPPQQIANTELTY